MKYVTVQSLWDEGAELGLGRAGVVGGGPVIYVAWILK